MHVTFCISLFNVCRLLLAYLPIAYLVFCIALSLIGLSYVAPFTRYVEESVVDLKQRWRPFVFLHVDGHNALSMERSPTEEETDNDGHLHIHRHTDHTPSSFSHRCSGMISCSSIIIIGPMISSEQQFCAKIL